MTGYAARQYVSLFLQKGHSVFVEGQLEYRNHWSEKTGETVHAEIVASESDGYLRRLEEMKVTEMQSSSKLRGLELDVM